MSWFYEFVGTRSPKAKWRFRVPEQPWFCLAGLWRPTQHGEAFTILTVDPGPDVAPYHNRQVVVLPRQSWAAWLDLGSPAEHLVAPSPAGTLQVDQVRAAPA